MEKLLLHICCPESSFFAVEELSRRYDVTLLFYNPNLFPESKYFSALKDVHTLSQAFGVPVIIGRYDPDSWFKAVKGREHEREGEERCRICSGFRMKETARLAKRNGFLNFSTTIAAGRGKDQSAVDSQGTMIASDGGINYVALDVSRKSSKRNMVLSKEHQFHMKGYCGCFFSEEMG